MTRAPAPTDLTKAEWATSAPLIPPAKTGGRPHDMDLRELVTAARYRHRGTWGWRRLPHEYPPWQTVARSVRQWPRDGTWDRLLAALAAPDAQHGRDRAGRPYRALAPAPAVRPARGRGTAPSNVAPDPTAPPPRHQHVHGSGGSHRPGLTVPAAAHGRVCGCPPASNRAKGSAMPTDLLAQAVDAALDLLAHGWELEACLAQFPAHAAALRPLLTIAQELRALAADDAAALAPPPAIDWARVLAPRPPADPQAPK